MNTVDLIRKHEGCTLVAKPDAKGKWVIGWGHDIPAPTNGQPTLTCTQEQADEWLQSDKLKAAMRAIDAVGLETWKLLNEARRSALIDMAFEMGGTGLINFKIMLAAIRMMDWELAKDEALRSTWAKQVPTRAVENAAIILTGEFPLGAEHGS